MVEALLHRLGQGDRHALARLLTLIARGEGIDEIARGLPAAKRPTRVVAVTGSGGVGKSTLIGKLLPVVRGHNLSIAVLACDPQSPLSGGALLGDRFRMGSSTDDGVFIRSVATVGGHGAVAQHIDLMIRVLESFGFDVVLIETVGAGQGDVAVTELADVAVLLVQPESGDEIQWEKAGILELADVVVVHKADLPAAQQTAAQVQATLGLSAHRQIPIVLVSSQTGRGLEDLWQTIAALRGRCIGQPASTDLLRLAHEELEQRWSQAASSESFRQAVHDWQQGRGTGQQIAANIIARLFQSELADATADDAATIR
jgi:LAO/AO transport system ATPase